MPYWPSEILISSSLIHQEFIINKFNNGQHFLKRNIFHSIYSLYRVHMVHTECVCYSLLLSDSVTSWTGAPQAPLSMNSPDKNSEVGCHSLLNGIFPTQGLNLGLWHCRQILHYLSHHGSSFGPLSLQYLSLHFPFLLGVLLYYLVLNQSLSFE